DEIECSATRGDFTELWMVRRITGEIRAAHGRLDGVTAPERLVSITQASRAEMARRSTGHAQAAHVRLLPPIQLDDVLHPPSAHICAKLQGHDPHGIPVRAREASDRGLVEMVVVVVREQHDIERRKGPDW